MRLVGFEGVLEQSFVPGLKLILGSGDKRQEKIGDEQRLGLADGFCRQRRADGVDRVDAD